jgi:hypothetical protein
MHHRDQPTHIQSATGGSTPNPHGDAMTGTSRTAKSGRSTAAGFSCRSNVYQTSAQLKARRSRTPSTATGVTHRARSRAPPETTGQALVVSVATVSLRLPHTRFHEQPALPITRSVDDPTYEPGLLTYDPSSNALPDVSTQPQR